jgi:hypothetical protein
MIRLAFASGLAEKGLPAAPSPVSGLTRMIDPSRLTGSVVVRRSWLRSAPPSFNGSTQRLIVAPPWPKSTQLKLAPSPPEAYSMPSGPKFTDPVEWLGYCWHQSSTRTCSEPSGRIFESRPLILHPPLVGSAHTSPYVGAFSPMGASWA